MGLFGRKESFEDRFPPERWNRLFTTLPMHAVMLSQKHGYDDQARGLIWETKFFAAYMISFPSYLDDISERLGGATRWGLFTALFGEDKGRDLMEKGLAYITLDDPQARRGVGFGAPDGRRFFLAVEQNHADPYGEENFSSLDSALQVGMIDFSQTI